MKKMLLSSGMLLASLLLVICGADEDNSTISSPDTKIDDVAGFLAAICEQAALCPDISPTQEEIEACPTDIRSKLSETQLAELERFTTYTKSQQDCIIECIGRTICDRFGGALSYISDSDVIEPFRKCEVECL